MRIKDFLSLVTSSAYARVHHYYYHQSLLVLSEKNLIVFFFFCYPDALMHTYKKIFILSMIKSIDAILYKSIKN